MGGASSKSRTGISALDKAVDATVKGIAGGATNIERNTRDMLTGVVGITQPGGLNNLGQYAAQNAIRLGTMGLINPEQNRKIVGPNGLQKKADETASGIEEQRVQDAANVIAEENRVVASTISGIVTAKKRSPGKSQTLLGPGSTGSLVSYKGT